MSLIKCPKCKNQISELEESCPICGFLYLQDAVNFLLQDCRTGITGDAIKEVMGTDYHENPVKDKKFKGPDSKEIRYEKDCFGLDGTMWFILVKDALRKASWYFVGRASQEYAERAAEISDFMKSTLGEPVSKEMGEGFSGEYTWELDSGDRCTFECSIFDGWIHILVAVSEKG